MLSLSFFPSSRSLVPENQQLIWLEIVWYFRSEYFVVITSENKKIIFKKNLKLLLKEFMQDNTQQMFFGYSHRSIHLRR